MKYYCIAGIMQVRIILTVLVVLLSSHGISSSRVESNEEGTCTKITEENGDREEASKNGESTSCSKETNSEVPAFLHDDLFTSLDRNHDGLLDQEELTIRVSKNVEDGVNKIFFLMGKLYTEFLTVEELKLLRADGIRILDKNEFSLFIERLLEENLISPTNLENFKESFENSDLNHNGSLSKNEQIEAGKHIFGVSQKVETITKGLYSTKHLKGMNYKNAYIAHEWINSLLYTIFYIHYEGFYKIIRGSDKDKNGYLNQGEITDLLKNCELTKNRIYELIAGDDNKTPCSKEPLSDDKFSAALIGYKPNTFVSWPPTSSMKLHIGLWKTMDINSRGYVLIKDFEDHLKIQISISALNEGKVSEIYREDIIKYVDQNADGVVTIYEMHNLIAHLRELGFNDVTLYKVFSSNWEGPLTEEYAKGRQTKIKIPAPIYKIYELFDEDLNGKINFKELRLTMEIVRLYIRTLWVNSIFHFADEDRNEKISFAEFQTLLKLNLYNFGKDICPDSIEIEENRALKIFAIIDVNNDNSFTKAELYQLIDSISHEKNVALKEKLLKHSEFVNGKNSPGTAASEKTLCKAYWVDFLDFMSHYGNETIKSEIVEKDFNKFDTNEDKWINFMEYNSFFQTEQHKWKIVDAGRFVEWLTEWMKGEPDFYSSQTLEEFNKYDTSKDHIISKGEINEFLQNHRKDYYTDEKTNGRFSRFDRNRDGHISFAEFYFLSLLKTRRQY